MLKIYAHSLGCPKNRVDTEHTLGSLGRDIRLTPYLGRADVIFLNTCGFILPAVEESVRAILEAVHHRGSLKRRPLLVVAGCLVGRYGAATLAKDLPEVDLWLDNSTLPRWPEYINDALHRPHTAPGRLGTGSSTSAWLKISDGCRHNCAFCTIPAIRGKHRSVPAQTLIDEARVLLEQGVKELVLVAQDTTAWGEDFGIKDGLVHLLSQLLPLNGLQWLRLMYLYPAGITDTLLKYMRDAGPHMLPYFDIPLQHAHPDILQQMGRPFAQDPHHVIAKIRNILPDAALRTTFIVGFPGETDAHFAALQQLVETVRFTHVGVFAYSPEEGTRAAALPHQVDDKVKQWRRDLLMETQADISQQLLQRCVGARMPVLVDAPHPEWPGLHTGRVWFQAPEVDGITYISGPNVKPGALLEADIVESGEYDLTALT